MPRSTQKIKPVKVKADDSPFVLEGADEDRIVRNGKQIIAACNLQITVEAWSREFWAMLTEVGSFCETNSNRIAECFASIRSSKIVLFFVPRSQSFDLTLSTELAKLDIEIATGFSGIGHVSTRQVPAWEQDRFIPVGSYRFAGWQHEREDGSDRPSHRPVEEKSSTGD